MNRALHQKREFPCTFRKKRLFLALLTSASLLITGVHAEVEKEPALRIYRSVSTEKKQIALTFDDGPHPHQTEKILDILDQYGVKATFFMVGVNVRNYPQVAKLVHQKGHEIGNHTLSHRNMKNMDFVEVDREMTGCEDALEELCECRPHLFRPPEGAITESVLKCAMLEDYELILWSIDTRDWENKNADEIVKNVLERIKPGDIVLLHDYVGHSNATPEALGRLLPELLSRGFEPVTVSRLLGIE